MILNSVKVRLTTKPVATFMSQTQSELDEEGPCLMVADPQAAVNVCSVPQPLLPDPDPHSETNKPKWRPKG